jgi:quercetin dioxygenase-like cupin family protein
MKKAAKYAYGRTVLYSDDNVDVVLIEWPPGVRSPAHDHGISHGMIRILEGSVYCDNFSKKTKKFISRLVGRKGDMLFETPDIVHIMGNQSQTKRALAIHIYTPPLKMKTYTDAALKRE